MILNFNFEMVNFPFLDRGVSCFPSYGETVYLCSLFVLLVCSYVSNFNNRHKIYPTKKETHHLELLNSQEDHK